MPFYVAVDASATRRSRLSNYFRETFGSPVHEIRAGDFELVTFGPDAPIVRNVGPEPESVLVLDCAEALCPPFAGEGGGFVRSIRDTVAAPPDYNCLVYNPTDGLAVRTSGRDWLPWYHTGGDGFVVSSHLFVLGQALGAAADDLGELQWIVFRFNLGSRTPFAKVARTVPGDFLQVTSGGVELRNIPRSAPPSTATPSRRAAAQVSWDGLVGEFSPLATAHERVGLFLSGGLDSRLALAAGRAAGVDMVTATHGQPGYEEVAIARRAASVERTQHLLRSVETGHGILASEDDLSKLARRADSTGYPAWLDTARLLRENGSSVFTSGFMLDASLGGHMWDPPSPRDRLARRMRTAIVGPSPTMLQGSDFLPASLVDKYTRMAVGALQYQAPLLREVYRQHLSSLIPQLTESLEVEIQRLSSHLGAGGGSDDGLLVAREFFLQNHVRGYSLGQERIARTVLPLVLPTVGPRLFEVLMEIPEWMKIDHALYFEVMRRFAPRQARLPWSATSLPVVFPAPILELSRAVRAATYKRANEGVLRRRSGTSTSKRGALSFEVIGRRSPMESIQTVVDGDGARIDVDGVGRWIDEIRSYERKALNLTPLTELLAVGEFA